jgi:hypothetical protein
MTTSTVVANGFYRIRQAGAKSQIAIAIHNGKKCHYVQIGSEQTPFANLEDCLEFVEGKGLEADKMSLDYGKKKAPPAEEAATEETTEEPTEE